MNRKDKQFLKYLGLDDFCDKDSHVSILRQLYSTPERGYGDTLYVKITFAVSKHKILPADDDNESDFLLINQ
jgi:hypothetical protein